LTMTPQSRDKRNAPIGRDVPAKIGQQPRTMYAALIKQPLPEILCGLVRRLSVPRQPQ